ncbi:MAG TPA: calcium/sodium antiporter [Aliiroseovarius sp.]|nr:calcium/sodium antiporter [Aliiroseovarius sp.]
MVDFLFAILGLVILLLSGDALVRGAVNLSLRLGVPALIVSLTIVAFGTSAPELLISISSVLDGVPGIALGNVIGSNTANVLLVLGVPALVSGLHTSDCDTKRNYVYMMIATLLFIAACFLGPITWVHGLILLGALGFVLFRAFHEAKAHRKQANGTAEDDEDLDLEGADPAIAGWKIAMFLVLGLVGLPLGADILVESSVSIARQYGVSETVIGLTLVAIGTSMPELATTVMAALRRQADVALGNVIGSNMFNLLAIIGITSLVGPLPVASDLLQFDIWVMLASSLLLVPFVFMGRDINRLWGVVLAGLYALYMMVLLA